MISWAEWGEKREKKGEENMKNEEYVKKEFVDKSSP